VEERLTFIGPVEPPSRRLGWIAAIAVTLCLISVAVLTMLVPNGHEFGTKGGYVPISTGQR
jgi:hypothetical protein